MLPNHSPLVIAEQFGTLESLYPGRIDLGLGRAPGTDMLTSRALRRDLATAADQFPQDVIELQSYFDDRRARSEDARRARRRAEGADVDSGLEPVRRATRRACWACRSPSPRISRRTRCIRRSAFIGEHFQPSRAARPSLCRRRRQYHRRRQR